MCIYICIHIGCTQLVVFDACKMSARVLRAYMCAMPSHVSY